MPEFILGLKLCELFYHEVVQPILDKHFPKLVYSAGLMGQGSDVLGFDNPESIDHGWGPRLLLFLTDADYTQLKERIATTLGSKLPFQFRGYSTHFVKAPSGSLVMKSITKGLINHQVEVTTARSFFERTLNINPRDEIAAKDWLTFSEQGLLEVTSGKVFHDGLNELGALREKFSYYPKDLWRYLLAAQWNRIGQEEPFVGRCGDVGDELGSKIIAARLVRDLMRLCFLMEKRYAPYPKWFGTAFTRLTCARELAPLFESVLAAPTWKERERHLSGANKLVARMHNNLGITQPLDPTVSPFHNRPYLIIHGDRFAKAIRATIKDEEIRRLPERIGSVDQFSDSTDILSYPKLRARLKALYTP